VGAALEEAANSVAARRARVLANLGPRRSAGSDLPQAVELVAPGKLQISYQGAPDLLARIAELAAAATQDFPRFRRIVEGRD
jgi:hypothetical protein